MTTFIDKMSLFWRTAVYHYCWRRYAQRCTMMRRRFPEEFSLAYVQAAHAEMGQALLEAPMPGLATWLVKVTAWRVVPMMTPFGTIF